MEENKRYTREMAMRFRMILAIYNMLEAEMVDFESICKRAGYAIIHEQKRDFKKLKHLVTSLRSMDKYMDAQAQEGIGISSDFCRYLCWLTTTHCADNQERWQQLNSLIKMHFPQLIEMDLSKDERILYDDYDCERIL